MTALIEQIDALLDLDAKGALTPHGIGGLARELLTKARTTLAALPSPDAGEPAAGKRDIYEVANIIRGIAWLWGAGG